jgi:aminoglycoside phosphotransferase (APT) family kinase protein
MTERRTANIILDGNQILQLVKNALPNCHTIDRYELLSGGAVNSSYKIIIGNEAFVLRLYTRKYPHDRSRKYCNIERELFKLVQTTVTVPELIFSDENHESWAYALFRFVPGTQIDKVAHNQSNKLSFKLGETLASIHNFRFPNAGLFGLELTIEQPFALGSSPYFDEAYRVLSTAENVRRRLGNNQTDELLSFITTNKSFFPVVGDNICLTHSDFKPVNLLYTPAKTVCVLDWEFAHAGLNILDFAILLRHRHQFPLDLDALKNGYEYLGGLLPDGWVRSALITDLVNIMHLLDSPTEQPQLFAQLMQAIKTTIKS